MEAGRDTNGSDSGRDSGGDSTDATNWDSESRSYLDGSTDNQETMKDKVKQMTNKTTNITNQMSEAAAVEAQQPLWNKLVETSYAR